MKRTLGFGVPVVILIVIAFLVSMRSCLGKYDQKFKFSKAMIFENLDGKDIVVMLLQDRRTTSYRRGGGINYTSYRTSIYIQNFDLKTGKPLNKKEIGSFSKIKNHPVSVWGAGNKLAWCFVNEIRAFDPVSLEEIVTLKKIEEKNPELKGKLPAEARYYQPKLEDGFVLITALDGIDYHLDIKSLECLRAEESGLEVLSRRQELDQQMKILQDSSDSNYQRFRFHSRQYSNKEITYAVFHQYSDEFNSRRSVISSKQDSVRNLQSEETELIAQSEAYARELKNLLSITSYNIPSITHSTDSINQKFYGLHSTKKRAELTDYFRIGNSYDETDRNKIYSGELIARNPAKGIYNTKIKIETVQPLGKEDYLQGGFLLNFETAKILQLKNPDGFIIVHRDIIGADGKMMLTRVDLQGNRVWQVNTGLPVDLQDIRQSENYLVLFGKTNEDLSSGDANSMLIVRIKDGAQLVYDFMERTKTKKED